MSLILISLSLGCIFIQDLRHRIIHLGCLTTMAVGSGLHALLYRIQFNDWLLSGALNALFLLSQFILILIYFSIVNRGGYKHISNSIGAGDIVFLTISCMFFDFIGFCMYYISGLTLALVFHKILSNWRLIEDDRVPLAGYMSLYLFVVLASIFTEGSLNPYRIAEIFLHS